LKNKKIKIFLTSLKIFLKCKNKLFSVMLLVMASASSADFELQFLNEDFECA
jgi:hypothetical protein